jgi:hypothetical protein
MLPTNGTYSDDYFKEFCKKNSHSYSNIDLSESYIERIKALKNDIRKIVDKDSKPKVVILGGGPAGLLRAIQSIVNGNPTQLIEMRSKEAIGRENTVALTKDTIAILKYCGMYQYLIEKGQIYPPNSEGYICVTLMDLEKAMKTVLTEINGGDIIIFNSQIDKINTQKDKLEIIVKTKENKTFIIKDIDILVNCEGYSSKTNKLLEIERRQFMENIPALIGFFNKQKIYNLNPFINCIERKIIAIALTFFYHTLFFLKFIFQKSFRNEIIGALILKTPNQVYVGCSFSDEINKLAVDLKNNITNLQNDVAKSDELKKAEKEYASFSNYWINLSICASNLRALILKIGFHKRGSQEYVYTALNNFVDSFKLINLGADKTDTYYKIFNQAVVLLAGDAAATVDPATGLGCNTALQSSVTFLDFMENYDKKHCMEKCTEQYQKQMDKIVRYILSMSYSKRLDYMRTKAPHLNPGTC